MANLAAAMQGCGIVSWRGGADSCKSRLVARSERRVSSPRRARVNSWLGPVSELTPPRGRRFSGRAEPRLQPRLIGRQVTSQSYSAALTRAVASAAPSSWRGGADSCKSRLVARSERRGSSLEESRVNSRLGPVSELTPANAASAAGPSRGLSRDSSGARSWPGRAAPSRRPQREHGQLGRTEEPRGDADGADAARHVEPRDGTTVPARDEAAAAGRRVGRVERQPDLAAVRVPGDDRGRAGCGAGRHGVHVPRTVDQPYARLGPADARERRPEV